MQNKRLTVEQFNHMADLLACLQSYAKQCGVDLDTSTTVMHLSWLAPDNETTDKLQEVCDQNRKSKNENV